MSNPRIISGTARGLRLKPVPGDTTRPVTDRVKEALFNILSDDVLNSTWLDLFAGTGSIGIEALSRGAALTRFNDLNRLAVQTIQYNLEHTGLKDKAQVTRMDALALLRQRPDRTFDYVYIAPPQYKELWLRALEALDANPAWLTLESWVIVQIDPVEYVQHEWQHFKEFEQRRYGSTLLVFYEPITPND